MFIHDALDELILCGETAFNVQNLRVKISRMSKTVPGKSVTGFQEQFKVSILCNIVTLHNFVNISLVTGFLLPSSDRSKLC